VDTRRRVLRGLAVLAVETGAHTIAEGIEAVDDLRLVRELGFNAAQGFLLREPAATPDHSPRPLKLLGSQESVPAS
jgi:EAL domain-containing protein (putative c-di-GMP-specific phosphodiesterase class I)